MSFHVIVTNTSSMSHESPPCHEERCRDNTDALTEMATQHAVHSLKCIYFFVFVFQLRNLLKGQRYTQVSRLRSNVYVVKGDTFMPKSVSGYLPPPWRKLAMHNSAHSFT